jgi:endonuclease III
MTAKSAKQPQNVIEWLFDQGGSTVGQVVEELLSRPGVSDGVAKMMRRAAKTKGQVDKNVETLLHLLNLPSRTDYDKLRLKIEHLQGSLVNLNMKLDRILAAQHPPKKPKTED